MTNVKDPSQLSTVHDAMIDAKMEQPAPYVEPTVAKSFRIEPDLFLLAQQICERNGTSVSEFCRRSIHRLISDYGAMFPVEQFTKQNK